MFESWQLRQPTAESAKWMEQITAAVRIANRAVAAQLVAIGQLFAYRYASGSAIDDWAVDTEAAVAAELSAGLRISQGLAADRLRLARAMRERLPQTADVFI